MKFDDDPQRLVTAGLTLEYYVVPWDAEIFRFPVAQIDRIEIHDVAAASGDYAAFAAWVEKEDVRLVSCRLGHDRLRESMFLEERGFRFVEMVYPMRLSEIDRLETAPEDIELSLAKSADLDEIQDIARHAFATGRLNVDPRLDADLGGRRYAAWVGNSFDHPAQRLYKATEQGRIAAFFVTEMLPDQRVYWHLTAVAPEFRGRGIGKRAWQAMIMLNQREGARIVETTISARNTPVVNLYVGLRFRFLPPLMTFHWCRARS